MRSLEKKQIEKKGNNAQGKDLVNLKRRMAKNHFEKILNRMESKADSG
jgi:hypothetical protein